MHDRQNHYDILQIPKTSSKREIKNRFYEASQRHLPDEMYRVELIRGYTH